jgi:hypothetical protein
MLIRSRNRDRSRGGSVALSSLATGYLNGVTPYHYADFITNRMLYAGADVGNVTQATGYSFTRASDGYYTNADGTLTNFASGALRRGDRGVLIEGSRTNLLTYSQEFDNASWAKDGGATVSANAVSAPDGTTTADGNIAAVASGSNAFRQNITISNATVYTFSVFLKYNSQFPWIELTTVAGGAKRSWINVETGAVGTVGHTSVTLTALANGWYRAVVVYTSTGTGEQYYISARPGNGNSDVISGDGVTPIWYAWGAQLEAASFPSSYVKSEAAAATRASDVLTYTAGVSYGLSLWAEFERAVDTGLFEGLVAVDDGSAANFTAMRVTTSDAFQGRISTASASQYAQNAGTVSLGVHKMAIRSSAASARMCYDGTLATETTGITAPATPTLLRVGAVENNGNPANNYIRRVAIVQGAVSDANLQGMTQ